MHITLPARPRPRSLAAALLCASSIASAAPYATTYQGVIANSSFPQILDGQAYTLTLVLDNGGASPNAQTWGTADNVTCAILRMNNAGNALFVADLVTGSAANTMGAASTDGSGALTAMFSQGHFQRPDELHLQRFHVTRGLLAGHRQQPCLFGDSVISDPSFDDASGGVQMASAAWSNPVPFTGACDTTTTFGQPRLIATPTPVPTLGASALLALGLLLGVLGWRRRST
ncbi:hypothetical protein CCO03_13850 [Comamonas serinivorans]|uniref:IPTL-CTERM protein sorting domain-containing protein n=1 Tax=Comamonas serinivorans TaxID=1082851 RepID=A0A1Y0EQU1_9BURK|nr:hypothetical protein [Comamonas serinivorans]ARU05622.1 hypothetical protein CCO03_13850 [Comamonas serinivorans]